MPADIFEDEEKEEEEEEEEKAPPQPLSEKERKAFLRGKVTFAQEVWKEFKMPTTLFD